MATRADAPLPTALTRDIVVVGTSAGGVEALRALVSGLPDDTPCAVFVVMHIGAVRSQLAAILARDTAMPVQHASDGQVIRPGRILVAPPDQHLMLDDGVVRVWRGPKENRVRPAIDPLFRSAALIYGPRAIGVLMSGGLDDGVAGLVAIQRAGGVTIVQDPADAMQPTLPQNALAALRPDHVEPARAIGGLVGRLAREPVSPRSDAPSKLLALEQAAMKGSEPEAMKVLGTPSMLTCPECHGGLVEIADESVLRFRCHTGHAFTATSLLADQDESIEQALFGALRALRENADLARQLAARAETLALSQSAARFEQRAAVADRHAETLQSVLERSGEATPDT